MIARGIKYEGFKSWFLYLVLEVFTQPKAEESSLWAYRTWPALNPQKQKTTSVYKYGTRCSHKLVKLYQEAATHIFFSVGAFFSVSWAVGSARMAAWTLLYISARSSASKPSFSSPLKSAWYFSGSSSFKSCSPSPQRESVLLPLETFLWVNDNIICKKFHLKVVLGEVMAAWKEKLNLHVVSNVTTQDVLAVSFSIQTLVLFAKTRKPLLTMGNVQTSIESTLY